MDFSAFSFLKEGILRRTGAGKWFVEVSPGHLIPLDELLSSYKNKSVRMTCVDLDEVGAVLKSPSPDQDS